MALLRLGAAARRVSRPGWRVRVLTAAAAPSVLIALATAALAAPSAEKPAGSVGEWRLVPVEAELARPGAVAGAPPRTVFTYWTNAAPPFAAELPPGTALPFATSLPPEPTPVAAKPDPAASEGVASGTSGLSLPAVDPGPPTALEIRLLEGINAARREAGVPPLLYDEGLQQIARIRSRQMADEGYFGHRDATGRTMYVELLAHFGYTYAWAGENLAMNNYDASESAERALASLMASPSHRANLLTTDFSRIGVGVVSLPDGRHIYTMVFVG